MLRDLLSLCNRILPARASFRLFGSLVCALHLFGGCASSPFKPLAFIPDSSNSSEASTFRSQDASLSNDWLDSRSGGFSDQHSWTADGSNASTGTPGPRTTAAGHSFTQPKARLGRPVPLAEKSDAGRDSKSVKTETLLLNRSPPSDGAKSPSSNISNNSNTEERSPWSTQSQSMRRPAIDDAGRTIVAEPGAQESGSSSDERQGISTGDSRSRKISPEQDVRTISSSEIESGASSPVPESPGSSGNMDTDTGTTEEPTMLERLKGLYNPRLDENTDKLKKQIRRWPEAFGLRKERETAESSEPPAVEARSSEQRSADVSAVDSGIPDDKPDAAALLQQVIADLEQQLATWPQSTSRKPEQPALWRQKQTDLRMLYMIAGRPAESVRIIESLPEEEQEFWQSLMLSMGHYRESGDSAKRAEQLTESLDYLRTAARKLQPLSQLSIRRMTLCDRIDGFGTVSAFPTSNFEPGQRILIYAELQNFKSELTQDGRYRSEFAAIIEFVREGSDEIVADIRVPRIEDRCDVERTDYFQSFELTLPALEGKYSMRLRLKDQLSLQTAESTLEFSVRSKNQKTQ